MPSFKLALGGRILRKIPLMNKSQPEEYQRYRGTVELLVWCSWRLQTESTVLASSDQLEEGIGALRSLDSATVRDVMCLGPAHDLVIDFEGGKRLVVFCDHVQPGASISENWEFSLVDLTLIAGPGTLMIIERDSG